jgi:hypothetical protein
MRARSDLAFKMRPIHNVVSDLMEELDMVGQVRETVYQASPGRWILQFKSLPGALIHSRLTIEILENAPYDPVGCVLEKYNVGRSVMTEVMDTLMDLLDDEEARGVEPLEQPPQQGEPPVPVS